MRPELTKRLERIRASQLLFFREQQGAARVTLAEKLNARLDCEFESANAERNLSCLRPRIDTMRICRWRIHTCNGRMPQKAATIVHIL